MTRTEWSRLAAVIDSWWPATDFDEAMEAAWFVELEAHEASGVEAAIRGLLRDGSAFAPSLGQVMARLGDVEGHAERPFEVVLDVWSRAVRRSVGDARGAVTRLLIDDPFVGAFVTHYGPARLLMEPMDHEIHGGLVRQRIAESYARFCARDERERQHLLVSAAMRERPLIDGPRRLDPLATLQPAPIAIKEEF